MIRDLPQYTYTLIHLYTLYPTSMHKNIALLPLISLLAVSCYDKNGTSPSPQEPVFRRVPSSHSGVIFENALDENLGNFFDFFAYVYNGAGVGVGDVNNDGLPDIYFTGNEVPNKLYLNYGDMKFRDITESAGVEGTGGWNNGVTMVDVNADGLLDIYVCKGGWMDTEESRRNLLYINQGNKTFKEQARDYGLDEPGYSLHASFFDMDNDNDLDVYITNRPDSFNLPLTQMLREKKLGRPTTRDKLYINEKGKFREISREAGITNNFGYALSVVTSDLNNDGYIDIFVANDFAESDYLYVNQGNGTFREQIKESTNHIALYSMGTDVADINNDGLEDIMVTEMLPEDYKRSKVSMPSMDVEGFNEIVKSGMHKQYMHNVLHLNQGDLLFSDVSQLAGVTKTEWSWSCLLSDFDNDGYRDLFVANGYRRDVFDGDIQIELASFVNENRDKYRSAQDLFQRGFDEMINVYDPIMVPNYLFRNKGDLHFENVSAKWGFEDASFSNGAAVGDLDGDGDLDLVINNLDGEAFVYENTSAAYNNYVKLDLEGPPGNADGLGAKVTLYYGDQIQYFENKTVRGYLSSNEPVVHFGLGSLEKIDSIRVLWNDGKENVLKDVGANQLLQVSYELAADRKWAEPVPQKIFIEEPQLVDGGFVHRENEFNEYAEQILLPHMFSKSGPFIAVGDVNNDGTDDFYVGGAAGHAGGLFIGRDGKWIQKPVAAFQQDKAYEDMGVTLFDADKDNDLDLYVVSGGSEFPSGSGRYRDRLYLNDGNGNFTLSALMATASSGSCVVPLDVDGDGDLDLFRGGQVVAGAYPYAPDSYLLINEDGKFADKTSGIAPALAKAGMVNSAIWVDLNGDGSSELIVVGEWMPVRIFQYKDGHLEETTSSYGLNNMEGWWNKVIADDLDGDGDPDILLGNLGENYKFTASAEKPFQVFAKDFDGNGTNDIFLAKFLKDSLLVPIRGRECTSQQMPVIAEKFPTFTAFAESDLPSILGTGIGDAINLKAHLFSTVILINEKGRFTVRRLPTEAQFSTVNGIIVQDFDQDGIKDILLAGNRFDTEVETTPADASPGLFLKGTGNLEFKPTKHFVSGFSVPYNVKEIQAIRNGDTRAILVGVNSGPLRIFRNVRPAGNGGPTASR